MLWLRLIILYLAIWLIAGYLRKLFLRGPAAGKNKPQRMARCDHCGLFLPENETIVSGNHRYCCKQHAALARK